MGFVILSFVLMTAEVIGIVHEHRHQSLQHRQQWESYDQANLKRHDVGCPTAIWIAPHGVLEQC